MLRFLEYLYAIFLGIIFGYAVFGLLAFPLSFIAKELLTGYLLFVIELIFILWTLYLFHKKTFFYQSLILNKAKIRTSIILIAIWILIMVVFPDMFYNFSLQMLPLYTIYGLLMVYPFVALLHTCLEKSCDRKLILLLILINPLFLMSFAGLGVLLSVELSEDALTEPCGVTIVEVTQGSPAENAGLQTGDVITSLDEHQIKEVNDIVNYNGSFSKVVTNRGAFSIDPELEDGSYILGIRVEQARCDK